MRAETLYRKKLNDMVDSLVDLGVEHVDEFKLRLYFDESEINEIAGLYVDSTSRYQRQDYLLEGAEGENISAVLSQYMKSRKSEEKARIAIDLLERLNFNVTSSALPAVIDNINFELPHFHGAREWRADLEANPSFSTGCI
jgi:hypothetical protein